MNFFRVLRDDIRNILHNKFIKLAIVVMTAMPLVYGGLYLAAFWDPYSRTQTLPVAVANLDKGGFVSDENDDSIKDKVNYGEDIVEKLKNNHDLDWQFVKTQGEAQKGLNNGKYYAIVIIPSDFSKRLADAEKGKLEKPKLVFTCNRKRNYVVGIIMDKASKALKDDITASIVDNSTNKAFDSLFTVRDGMESAADGTSQVKDGVSDLKDKVPALTSGVKKLYDGSSTLSNKLGDASDGSNKLRDGIGTLNSKMPDLQDGANKLYDGSSTLTKKIKDASDGSKTLRDGVLALNDKMPDLSDGVNKLYDGSTVLKEGLEEVHDNMPDMVDGVGKLRDGASDLENGLQSAVDGANQLYTKDANGNVKQDSGLPAIKSGSDQINAKIPQAVMSTLNTPGSDGIKPMDKICGGLSQILNGMNQLDPYVESGQLPISDTSKTNWKQDLQTITTLNSLFTEIKSSQDSSKINSDLLQIASILNGSNPNSPSPGLPKIVSHLNSMAAEIQKSPYFSQSTQLQTVYGGLEQAAAGISSLDSQLATLEQTLALYQGTSSLSNALGQATSGIGTLVDGLNTLHDGSQKLHSGLNDLYNSTEDLQDGIDTLYDGSKNLNTGIDQFKGTIPELSNGIDTLSDGTRDLSDGLFKISEGSKTLTDKLKELKDKIPDLVEGVQELYDGSNDLSDGLLKLHDGSVTLRDGLKSLNDKMPDLSDGTNKLYEGVSELNTALKDGASKLSDNLVASGKDMGKFLSDPINLKDKPLYNVSKYGEGLEPYFVSLALWVGALLLFFVVNDKTNKGRIVKTPALVTGKYLVYCIVGIVQAVFVSIAVLKLGLKPSNMHMYFGYNIFLSFVFIAIIECLVFLLEDGGRVGAIVLLLLQLTSCNGTFPAELEPKFFQILEPFLPFTYSISALREINSGIDMSVLRHDTIILALMALGALISTMILKPYADKIKFSASAQMEKMQSMIMNKKAAEEGPGLEEAAQSLTDSKTKEDEKDKDQNKS